MRYTILAFICLSASAAALTPAAAMPPPFTIDPTTTTTVTVTPTPTPLPTRIQKPFKEVKADFEALLSVFESHGFAPPLKRSDSPREERDASFWHDIWRALLIGMRNGEILPWAVKEAQISHLLEPHGTLPEVRGVQAELGDDKIPRPSTSIPPVTMASLPPAAQAPPTMPPKASSGRSFTA